VKVLVVRAEKGKVIMSEVIEGELYDVIKKYVSIASSEWDPRVSDFVVVREDLNVDVEGSLEEEILEYLRSYGSLEEGEGVMLEAHYTLRNTLVDDARGLVDALLEAEILVVGACGYYGVLAERFKGEFSENSKMLVKAEVYPESAHNDIVAWQARRKAKTAFIAIKGGGGVCDKIMEFASRKYREHGIVEELNLGTPSLPSIMRGALIGGYASVLMAREKGVDPATTPVIEEYKRMLANVMSSTPPSQ
jgi:glucose/mannose-6-phosphate isomerase